MNFSLANHRDGHRAQITTSRPSACVHGVRKPAAQQRVVSPAAQGGQDFVTRVFGSIFGQEALSEPEPMGMKRISDEAAKELYPATTDKWAEQLPSDAGEVATLRPLLAQTSIEALPLRLAYDAAVDGWDPSAFHAKVNTFGAAVVVAETVGGAIVGGYNPSGWIGLGEDRDSMAAFVFTWQNGDTTERPVKLPKVGGGALAVLDRAESGPMFGPDGLRIPLSSSSPQQAFSKLGSYYARMPDGGKTLFAAADLPKAGRMKGTELTSLRAYVAEGEPEQFELDGIVWKTSKADAK